MPACTFDSVPKFISHAGNVVSCALPDHADIELAAVDVLLDDCIALHLFVNELDAFAQALHVVDDRRLRDAERCIVGRGFDE